MDKAGLPEVVKIKTGLLRRVQKIQLEMAFEVKRICDLRGIKYFLIGGTLLGAVRHKGFIPWDDDIDMGMLRDDYEKFIECAEKDLGEGYRLQTWHNDEGMGTASAKIRKNETMFVELISANAAGHKGVYIDIFPFDNVPAGRFARMMHNLQTYILKRIVLLRTGYELWLVPGGSNAVLKKPVCRLLLFFSGWMSRGTAIQMMEKQMKKYNKCGSERIVPIGGAYGYEKETIERNWIANLVPLHFESGEFLCPGAYRCYLEKLYGDYMKPPPEEKRVSRHSIIELDLGRF